MIASDVDPAGAPVITRLGDGRLLVVYKGAGNTGWQSSIRSSGGWVAGVPVGSFVQRPSLTALAGGQALLAWIDAANDVQVRIFNSSTLSWASVVNVSGANNNVLGVVSVARGLNGATAELVYTLDNANDDLMHARLINGTWAATPVAGVSGRSFVAIAAPPLP